MAELLCAAFHENHGIETLIARCFAFVGSFLPLDPHFAIGTFIRDAIAGGPIRISGDGTHFRSYLYAADLAIWLWKIRVRGVPARPYDVRSSKELMVAQLADTVRAALNSPIEITLAEKSVAAGASSRYVPANTRARDELREAIRRTARYAALNPNFCRH